VVVRNDGVAKTKDESVRYGHVPVAKKGNDHQYCDVAPLGKNHG
jgi:hypothetical protein